MVFFACRRPVQPWLILALTVLISGCETVQSLSQWRPQVRLPSASAPVVPVQSAAIQDMEEQVLQQINEIRQQQGLETLRKNEKLAQVARNYSRRMAEQGFFAHTSPQGDTLVDRVRAVGIFFFAVGENLFTSTNIAQPVPRAIAGWMDSPGHRQNVLRPEYRETGIGVWKQGNSYYFTQLFMRSL